MKLYDSLTQRENQLVRKKINIYSCGPTVYNHIHLGNARPIVLLDVLVRYLKSQGHKINWVQNITDIDDKIIEQALKNQVKEKDISHKYLQSYLDDLKQLNIRAPQQMPLISDYLPQMIRYIQNLIDQGVAYQAQGNVFFDVNQVKQIYGQLSKQDLGKLKNHEPIAQKKSPLDFALWKKTFHGKQWNSPWGEGRPGWHTECVVLISHHFPKHNLDIHAGGVDLQFPHHENERAQHWATTQKELAKIWLHNGHLTFNQEKMSKTQGNVVLVRDFLQKYNSDWLRWIFLTTNYRQPLNFSEDLMEQASIFFDKLTNLRKKMIYYLQVSSFPQEVKSLGLSIQSKERFIRAMNHNLNTPQVLSLLEDLIKRTNKNLNEGQLENALPNYQDLQYLLKTLGFTHSLKVKLSARDRKLFQEWLALVKNKNYKKADEYRARLKVKDLI